MRSSIANKLTPIWLEVKDHLEKHGTLINDGNENNLLSQRLFLLKHYPSFLNEYTQIADQIISSKWLVKSINMLSVGSGCAIDYDAFYNTISNSTKTSFQYTGVESTLWVDPNGVPANQLRWVWSEISDLGALDLGEYNLFFFPKSLKALTFREIEGLKLQFQMKTFKQKRICIAFSSSNRKSPEFEDNRFKSIVQLLKKWHKYTVCQEEIVEIELGCTHEFEYPKKILTFMENHVHSRWLPEKKTEKVFAKVLYLIKN